MTSFVFDNNVESIVADNPLVSGATTLNVSSGTGTNFPSTFPYRLTIWDEDTYVDPTDDSGMEIVQCTARTTDALTIVRGKESTTQQEHAQSERVAMLLTAGIFNDSLYGITTKQDEIGGKVNIFVPAESFYLPVSNPATLTEIGGSGNLVGYSVLDFDDTTSEYAAFRVPIPNYSSGNIRADVSYLCGGISGNIGWKIKSLGVQHNEEFTGAIIMSGLLSTFTQKAATSSVTYLSTNFYASHQPSVTSGELLLTQVGRDVSDTMVGDARLLSVVLSYDRNL